MTRNMKTIKQKDIPLTARKLRDLKIQAKHSLYRMNAPGLDCYGFSVDRAGTRHLDGTIADGKDYSGGWEDIRTVEDSGWEYAYFMEENIFKKL